MGCVKLTLPVSNLIGYGKVYMRTYRYYTSFFLGYSRYYTYYANLREIFMKPFPLKNFFLKTWVRWMIVKCSNKKIFSFSNSSSILFMIPNNKHISRNKFLTTVLLFACVPVTSTAGQTLHRYQKKRNHLFHDASDYKQVAYCFKISNILDSEATV